MLDEGMFKKNRTPVDFDEKDVVFFNYSLKIKREFQDSTRSNLGFLAKKSLDLFKLLERNNNKVGC